MNGNTPIISATDFVRNFSNYVDNLIPRVSEVTVVRDSVPILMIKATPHLKNAHLRKFFGIWKGTTLDNDKLWADVLKRRNRKIKYSW